MKPMTLSQNLRKALHIGTLESFLSPPECNIYPKHAAPMLDRCAASPLEPKKIQHLHARYCSRWVYPLVN